MTEAISVMRRWTVSADHLFFVEINAFGHIQRFFLAVTKAVI